MYSFVNPDKVLNPITKVFRGFGLWEPSSSFIYRIYGILYLSFFGLFILFMVAYAFLLEDTSQLSFALWMMLTEFCAFLKFIYVYAYNDDLLDIIQRIKAFQLRTDKERILMDKYMKFIYKCGIFFAWSALFSVHVNQLTAPTFDKPTLPFGTWLPFWEWKTCRKDYWRAWVYQYIAINTSVLILVCVEIVISFTLLMTSIQIEIVGKRLEDIGKPVKNLRDDGSQQIVGCDYLIECIHLHRTALDLKERIQKLMNVPYFCQVASSGIVISAIVVDLAKGRGEKFSYSLGAVALTTQIFLICFFADKTIARNAELPNQLYKSDWINLIRDRKYREKFKAIMIVFMNVTQRETPIIVGHLFPMSLKTFNSIINLAYRVYAILSNQ